MERLAAGNDVGKIATTAYSVFVMAGDNEMATVEAFSLVIFFFGPQEVASFTFLLCHHLQLKILRSQNMEGSLRILANPPILQNENSRRLTLCPQLVIARNSHGLVYNPGVCFIICPLGTTPATQEVITLALPQKFTLTS